MLTGEGAFVVTNNKLTFKLQVYEQAKIATIRALREHLSRAETSLNLTSIWQGPDEHLQDFVANLWQASERIINNSEVNKLAVQ